ncbi:MAG: ABC transporter ATP-binding protein [Deltaproteobacteria bacterium]|nr:ABC transporter ATP-binding protein [Deltaproteobacteria bacterium]
MAAKAASNCLELRHISKSFQERRVLADVSLVVREGEIFGLIGPNGAGKTTLFNIITGLVRADEGQVLFHGQDITHWPPPRICHAGIARALQLPAPFPEMTGLENVLIGCWFGKRQAAAPDSEAQARELLARVGLQGKEEVPAGQLNLIDKRRLEVARALATRPHLLLLDEIAAGLSPAAVKQTAELVTALRDQGLTLLVTDHYLNLTLQVSDRVAALDQGEIITVGSPREVVRHPEVASAYLGTREAKTLPEAAP